MEGHNTAPFEIGQDVIAVRTRKNAKGIGIVKGKEYKVLDLYQCPACKEWHVDIGLRCEMFGKKICPSEQHIMNTPDCYVLVASGHLAPVKRKPDEIEICKEVLDSLPKITEERSDTIPKPQTVNN